MTRVADRARGLRQGFARQRPRLELGLRYMVRWGSLTRREQVEQAGESACEGDQLKGQAALCSAGKGIHLTML